MRRDLGKLHVLPNIHVASPCPADWSKMTGDERVRMCGQCNKHVFNLSNLTRAEAEDIVIEKNGNLCVRYYQRNDGLIMLKDCTVAASASRRRQLALAGAAALLATGGGLAAMMLGHRHSAAVAPPTIAAPAPTAEIDWRVREQAQTKDDAPPPAPIEVPTVLEDHPPEFHALGGAVAISPEDLK